MTWSLRAAIDHVKLCANSGCMYGYAINNYLSRMYLKIRVGRCSMTDNSHHTVKILDYGMSGLGREIARGAEVTQ